MVGGNEEERIQVICDEETLIDCAADIAKRWRRIGEWYTEYRYTRRVRPHEVVVVVQGHANKPTKVRNRNESVRECGGRV